MNNNAVIIICSTPNSRRLPRKCFMKIGGKMVLEHIFDKLKPLDIPVVLAIPYGISVDDFYLYEKIGKKLNVRVVSGFESPLHRMAMVTKIIGVYPKYIIRITHDDILIDADTVDLLLSYVAQQNAGYGITPTIVDGAGVEVITMRNLLHAAANSTKHVEDISYYVKGAGLPNPSIVTMKPRPRIERPYRLTLDYYEDYVVLENIFRQVGVDACLGKICEYLDNNQDILEYNKLPEITVYTCVKNGSRWIEETIKSVLDSEPDEYIIVDDGSTDDTLQKILKYKTEKKIKIIVNDENKGLASSSNIAVSAARGKYIMRVDADDICTGANIHLAKIELENTGAVICYNDYNEIDENGDIINYNVSAKIKHHIGCALVNRRFLNEIRFKEGIRHWDGLELYTRIKDRFKIAYYGRAYRALWQYRVHSESMSHNNTEERERCKP